jgi:hypothetical protein
MTRAPGTLPPSERDFEVYQLTVVEGVSTREAARQLGLSQTRIVQLRDRVCDWIATHLPDQSHLSKEERLGGAEYAAVEQLRFLYALAVDAWRESRGEETVQRQSGLMCETVALTRTSQGKVCYLNQAMRIAAQIAKLPQATVASWEHDARQRSAPAAPSANHPEEDCSPKPIPSPPRASSAASAKAPTTVPATICEAPEEDLDDVLSAILEPVHPLGDDEPRQSPPLAPLTRKQRRKRQRLLAQAQKRQRSRVGA